MRSLIIVATLAASALAGPVDPNALPQLSPKPTGGGPAVEVYSAKAWTDDLARVLLSDDNFMMLARLRTFEGRIDKAVPRDAALAAIVGSDLPVRVAGATGNTVDFDFAAAPVSDLMRIIADTARFELVWAPSTKPPDVTLRLKRVDARIAARQLIKLVGLELIERGNAWVVVDRGTKLDPALLAIKAPNTELRLRDIMPGEAQRLIDPKAGPGSCPVDHRITARVHGSVGLVLAVAATIPGPPCALVSSPDFKAGEMVGIFRAGDQRRAMFRWPKGSALFEPDRKLGQEVGDNYVLLTKDLAIEMYTKQLPVAQEPPPFDDRYAFTPCGSKAASRMFALRATIKVGKEWRALLVDSTGYAQLVTEKAPIGKATIMPGRVNCESGPSYGLTAP
jgi:hypothetical protein